MVNPKQRLVGRSLVVKSIIFLSSLMVTPAVSAESVRERVDRLWGKFEEATEYDRLRRRNKPKDAIFALTSLDYTGEPELQNEVMQRISRRLLHTLHVLNASDLRSLGILGTRSIGAERVRPLFEAIVSIAPHCGADFLPELQTMVTKTRDRRIAAAALATLVSLSQANPEAFHPALLQKGAKRVLTEKAEQLRASFQASLDKTNAIGSRRHFENVLEQLDIVLHFLHSDLSIVDPTAAPPNRLEGVLAEALGSKDLQNVQVAVDDLQRIRNLDIRTLVALQAMQKRDDVSPATRAQALQLVHREVQDRFSIMLATLPTDEADAHQLLQRCVTLLIDLDTASD